MTQHVLTSTTVRQRGRTTPRSEWSGSFTKLFDEHFESLFRVLNRLCGEPELASEAAQDAFMKLFQRGSTPDDPRAWLFTVGMNRLRNAKTKRTRRRGLLTVSRGERVHSDPAPMPDATTESSELRDQVRRAMNQMSERDRQLLVLHAEGYSYREIAGALSLHEPSVGTLLRRAKQAFRQSFGGGSHAP